LNYRSKDKLNNKWKIILKRESRVKGLDLVTEIEITRTIETTTEALDKTIGIKIVTTIEEEKIGVMLETTEIDATIGITIATRTEGTTITEEGVIKADREMINKENLRDITTTNVELNILGMAMRTLSFSHLMMTLVKARLSTATREVETLSHFYLNLLLFVLR
jgi:hypothetical protein